ncbi:hypothetical protein BJ912DRAFT_924107 [Pholiota molesta]|nr:hypothetical protein BJ912DRAFT_924107 [Pholiota molesta]
MPTFATPFTNELHTNYVPSSLDRDQIHALLVEPKKRLLVLNEKISEMERIIKPLKLERDSLADEIQQHTRWLTAFHCFPDDMLREIFLACLPDQHNAIMSCREAPLLLGRVCRRWRSVVYSTPSLWASLHIPYPSPMTHPPRANEEARRLIKGDQEKLKKHQVAIKDWIQRSGACPLSLSFICLDAESKSHNVHSVIQSYLDIMLSVSHRWNALQLYIPPGKLFNRIASIHKTSVPMLKHLRLSFSADLSVEDGLEWSSSNFLNSISLYSLDITYIPFHPNSVSSDFWSNLTYLTMDTKKSYHYRLDEDMASIEEAYFIFSTCRRLVHCSLEVFDSDFPDATSRSGVISLPLPDLKSLSIIGECQSLSTLFEWFTDLSALRGVSYHSMEPPSNQQTSPLITLLARTHGELQHLTTSFSYYTLADLTTVLALVPNLTHLTDESRAPRYLYLPESFNIGKAFLDLLTPLGGGSTYCPRLQALRLMKSQNSDHDVLTFLQRRMGASRCHPGAVNGGGVGPLREFCAELMHPAELDFPALLAEYVEDGALTMNIVHLPDSRPQVRTSWSQINPRVGLVIHEGEYT